MNEEISKFVLERLNLHGKSEPTELQDAYLKFKSCMDNLRKTLSDEQKKLLNRCETHMHCLTAKQSTIITARVFPMRLYFGRMEKRQMDYR